MLGKMYSEAGNVAQGLPYMLKSLNSILSYKTLNHHK